MLVEHFLVHPGIKQKMKAHFTELSPLPLPLLFSSAGKGLGVFPHGKGIVFGVGWGGCLACIFHAVAC